MMNEKKSVKKAKAKSKKADSPSLINSGSPSDVREKLRNEIFSEAKESDTVPNNVVNLLLDMQETKGYLSREDMINLSKEKKVPGVNIYGVATFYAQFKLNKPGKYILSICRGTACHVKGSAKLLEYLQELLEIKPGQTTKDSKFTLQCVNCIGACAKAPAMMVNSTAYGELDKKKIKQILESLP